jgi:mRNA interferase HicA
VKRTEFIKELETAGCFLKRHGKKHDIYANSQNGRHSPVPRHTEIKNSLCDLIRKQLGIENSRKI